MKWITSKYPFNLKVLGQIAIDMKNYGSSSNLDSQKAFDNFSHDGLVEMVLNSSYPKENFKTG